MEHKPPTLMIAIGVPHSEPDGDEDHLDREGHGGGHGAFGYTPADVRIRNLVDALHREGPAAARKIKLYSTALADLVHAFVHNDPHALREAVESATDSLHELIEMTRGSR